MGQKRHPLDVFRSSEGGFNKASRRRRTVSGKVLGSQLRQRPVSAPVAEVRSRRLRWPERPAWLTVRHAFYGFAGLVIVLALTLVLTQSFTSEDELPTLRKEEALPQQGSVGAEPRPAASVPSWFGIRACKYNGSTNGQKLALAAQEELRRRGFEDAVVVGYEQADAGVFQRYELIVGRAREAGDLERELDRLRSIDDWSGGNPAPFVSALIIPHPNPDY